MVNTNMEFKHPKYYKELRKRNKSDQVISKQQATASSTRAPGPGLKPQASSNKLYYTPTGILLGVDLGPRPQASSSKPQATETQAASDKHQASRHKLQASSRKQQAAQS